MTTWNDEKEFADMHAALLSLGFTEETRNIAYSLLSFCLVRAVSPPVDSAGGFVARVSSESTVVLERRLGCAG